MTIASEIDAVRRSVAADKARLYEITERLKPHSELGAGDVYQAALLLASAINRLGDALLMPLEPIIDNPGPAPAAAVQVLEHL